MGGGIQHQRGWLLEHQTTHSLFNPQGGVEDDPPTHRGGGGFELSCPVQVQTFSGGEGRAAARETYMQALAKKCLLPVKGNNRQTLLLSFLGRQYGHPSS